ncbi:heme-binding protein [Alkalibacterium sp. 20]|uniref:SOUL family heme-binding protein n=1 Tax=Alkalibacterium sp. 20 TaxID=1798803 RepID=UPI0009002B16|nr:heme-binding protein [Alkalibacterium sp. 20]OJF92817.1 hypothetical protein AX762_09540 [Alkalibacterium sp. 20]
MSKYETPDYDLVLEDDPYEIRKYVDFYMVEYDNRDDPKIDKGFGTLFKYISSDNKENEKISMTIPVIKEETDENMTIAFVVPEKYWGNIPEPNNPNLKIEKFDEGLFATVRYSGKTSKAKESKMKEKLKEWVEGKSYVKQSNYMVAVYDGPLTLPMRRRNEVWVRITDV